MAFLEFFINISNFIISVSVKKFLYMSAFSTSSNYFHCPLAQSYKACYPTFIHQNRIHTQIRKILKKKYLFLPKKLALLEYKSLTLFFAMIFQQIYSLLIQYSYG